MADDAKKPPQSLTVTPSTADLVTGETVQLTASNPQASWSSSNTAVAVVGASGLATGIGPGETAIKAQYKGEKGQMQITVRNREDPDNIIPPPIEPSGYGPQPTQTQPVGSVTVAPGAGTLQAAVTANPAGTTFWLQAGIYALTSPVTPKAGNSFVGEYGALLAGGDTTAVALSPAVDNVTVRNLIVEHFANPIQTGALSSEGRSGWVFANNETRLNFGYGIRFGPASQVLHNAIHHNGQLGIGCGTSINTDSLVEGNEIAYNNTNNNDPGFEAGGSKFTQTERLTVRGNWVHHNTGPGLWTDINNINVLYENNLVEDNTMMGIFHEISYACIIRGNVVNRNGAGFKDWIWGAGILIAASPDVEVYGNTLNGNADGIGAVQQNRSGDTATHGAHEISNLYVHDNDVTQTEGWTGLVQDVSDTSYFSSRNNRFLANTYHVSSSATLFTWDNQELTLAQWQAKGLQ